MLIDFKTTVWERFEIEDENKELLLAFLKENPEASPSDIYDWYCGNGGDPQAETIEGSYEEMTPEENGGCYTIQILLDDGEMIYQNGK